MQAVVKSLGVGPVVLAVSLAAGCGGNFGRAGYDQIKEGMARAEVEEILGPGTEVTWAEMNKMPGMVEFKFPKIDVLQPAGAPKTRGTDRASAQWVKWGDDRRFILVGFVKDKVIEKKKHGL